MGLIGLFIICAILILFALPVNENVGSDYEQWVENAKLVTIGSKWDVRLPANTSPFIQPPYGIVTDMRRDGENVIWVMIDIYSPKDKYLHPEAIRLNYRYELQFFKRFKYKV